MGNWHVNGAELFTANGKMNVEDKFAASRLEPKVVTVRLQAESRQCLIYEYLKLRINQFYIDTNSTEQKPEGVGRWCRARKEASGNVDGDAVDGGSNSGAGSGWRSAKTEFMTVTD
ncbi:hypothetical protein HZH68_001789 [Vespula germanica]|uniref:Uncharacterized protein n=1 Tax=Vespula germanica TaxID=30212 RepID=A0A834NWC7_VESGE|nr:hypothetical protein HZH68_001789 [Vespula germanica]